MKDVIQKLLLQIDPFSDVQDGQWFIDGLKENGIALVRINEPKTVLTKAIQKTISQIGPFISDEDATFFVDTMFEEGFNIAPVSKSIGGLNRTKVEDLVNGVLYEQQGERIGGRYFLNDLAAKGFSVLPTPTGAIDVPAPAHDWVDARCNSHKGWSVVSYKGWNENSGEFFYCLKFVHNYHSGDDLVKDGMRADKMLKITFDTVKGK